MARKTHQNINNKDLIKFIVPKSLKSSLQIIALERSISLSALLRIITSQYTKHDQEL